MDVDLWGTVSWLWMVLIPSIFMYVLSLPSFRQPGSFSHCLKECNTYPSQLFCCVPVSVQLSQHACEHFWALQSPVGRKRCWKLAVISHGMSACDFPRRVSKLCFIKATQTAEARACPRTVVGGILLGDVMVMVFNTGSPLLTGKKAQMFRLISQPPHSGMKPSLLKTRIISATSKWWLSLSLRGTAYWKLA